MKKGYLIVFEGIDGAGLTTNSKFLVNWLNENKLNAVYTKEPTNNDIGKIIRKYLKINSDPFLLTLLFTADRKIHVKNKILPEIKDGKIVICDRYFYSTIAYQSTHGVDEKIIREINKNFPKPNLVFLLDIDPSISLKRKKFSSEIYEKVNFLKKVRKKFLEIAFSESFIVIPSYYELKLVQERILKVIKLFLEEEGIEIKC